MNRLSIYLLLFSQSCVAGEADVIDVIVRHSFDNVYNFDVTIQHADDGWHHYADGWEVISGTDGKTRFAVRPLRHPHLTEQPFTRSMPIQIPQRVEQVIIRAHDNVHGYGGREITVIIPPASGNHKTNAK